MWRNVAQFDKITPFPFKLRHIMLTPYDLLAAINQAPPGITLAQVLALQPQLPRRTAQRWIGQLIADNALEAFGAARARRYYVRTSRARYANLNQQDYAHMVQQERAPYGFAWSADSRDILTYIEQPLSARHPVPYQAAFLEDYQPNQSWYLPETIRRQLHGIGRTGSPDTPAGTHGRAILHRLLIDLSWASCNLEGNTYSWLDTRDLLQYGKEAQGKSLLETQMILNHKRAIEFLIEDIDSLGFDRFTLFNLHAILSENLLENRRDEGRIRNHPVGIGQSGYRPLAIPQTIAAMFDLMLAKANAILDPFEQSFFMMVHLPYLQPFADVNKRTSRLIANLPLFRANLCPLTFLDMPEQHYIHATLGVYEMTRVELLRDVYVAAYQRSSHEYVTLQQNLAQPDPLRLAWRDLITQTVRCIVQQLSNDPMSNILQAINQHVPEGERSAVQALMVDALRNLHEGALARHGLRPSEWQAWQDRQASPKNT